MLSVVACHTASPSQPAKPPPPAASADATLSASGAAPRPNAGSEAPSARAPESTAPLTWLGADQLASWLRAHPGSPGVLPRGARCRPLRAGVPLTDGLLCVVPIPQQSDWDNGSEDFRRYRHDGRQLILVWSGPHTFGDALELAPEVSDGGDSVLLRDTELDGCARLHRAAVTQVDYGDPRNAEAVTRVCVSRGRYAWQDGAYGAKPSEPRCRAADSLPRCTLPASTK